MNQSYERPLGRPGRFVGGGARRRARAGPRLQAATAASLRDHRPAWPPPPRESPAARRAAPGPERPGQSTHGACGRLGAASPAGLVVWSASAGPARHAARPASRPSPERQLPAREASPSNQRPPSLALPASNAPAREPRQPERVRHARPSPAERRPPPQQQPQSAPERPAQEKQEASVQEREQAAPPPAPGAPVGASTGRDTPLGRLPAARRDGRMEPQPRRHPRGRSSRPPRPRPRRRRQLRRSSRDGAA